jgi:hypothetical protein
VLVLGGIICSVLFLFFCLVHLASLGYRLQLKFSSRSRSRCSEGGFGLWLGDEGIIVVKRAHNPLYSNTFLLWMLWNSTCAQNVFVQNHSRNLNKDELTLSHQPFNSDYECNFIKSAARSSKMFKN